MLYLRYSFGRQLLLLLLLFWMCFWFLSCAVSVKWFVFIRVIIVVMFLLDSDVKGEVLLLCIYVLVYIFISVYVFFATLIVVL